MNLRPALIALVAVPAALHAEPWNKVDELPGGIAIEIDEASEVEALDGVRLIERATFRRELPSATMETAISVDCQKETAKIRGIRLVQEGKVVSENVTDNAPYNPINPGSSEAIYFKALCGTDVSGSGAIPDGQQGSDAPPEATDDAGGGG